MRYGHGRGSARRLRRRHLHQHLVEDYQDVSAAGATTGRRDGADLSDLLVPETLPAVLAPIRAPVGAQLAAIRAPLLLVRLLLLQVVLQGREVAGEFSLVRCDGGGVVRGSILPNRILRIVSPFLVGLVAGSGG